MKIYLVRHGEATRFDHSTSDFNRKLTQKGITQSRALAQNLADFSFNPELTLCSEASRTKETCAYLTHVHSLGEVVYLDALYLANLNTLLAIIWKLDHGKDVLLIGHNEGISMLASYFTGEQIIMRTAECVSIQFELDQWSMSSQDTGTIVFRFRPDEGIE
jgi:phosphohistidine phosphatase